MKEVEYGINHCGGEGREEAAASLFLERYMQDGSYFYFLNALHFQVSEF